MTYHREPGYIDISSNSVLTYLYINARSGAEFKSDVSLAHSWNGEIISQAFEVDGFAASKREQRKFIKYNNEIDATIFPTAPC